MSSVTQHPRDKDPGLQRPPAIRQKEPQRMLLKQQQGGQLSPLPCPSLSHPVLYRPCKGSIISPISEGIKVLRYRSSIQHLSGCQRRSQDLNPCWLPNRGFLCWTTNLLSPPDPQGCFWQLEHSNNRPHPPRRQESQSGPARQVKRDLGPSWPTPQTQGRLRPPSSPPSCPLSPF